MGYKTPSRGLFFFLRVYGAFKTWYNNIIIMTMWGESMSSQDFNLPYLRVLDEELVIAVGCTEPVSLSLAAAKLKIRFNREPSKIIVKTSGPFFKNIRAAVVPGTKTLSGIKASIAAGHISGDPTKDLEVLSDALHPEALKAINLMAEKDIYDIQVMKTNEPLHFILRYQDDDGYAEIEVKRFHTGTVRLEVDGKQIPLSNPNNHRDGKPLIDRSFMRFDGIIDFVESIDIDTLKHMFDPTINHNLAIAKKKALKGPRMSTSVETLIMKEIQLSMVG